MNEEKRFELESEMTGLQIKLGADWYEYGDWKIAKYQEYVSAGLEAPYDIQLIHNERQRIRDRINEIRKELEELNNI